MNILVLAFYKKDAPKSRSNRECSHTIIFKNAGDLIRVILYEVCLEVTRSVAR